MRISRSLTSCCRKRLLRRPSRTGAFAQLTDELALKSALFEQAETNATEAKSVTVRNYSDARIQTRIDHSFRCHW
jgi:hypothetical protein